MTKEIKDLKRIDIEIPINAVIPCKKCNEVMIKILDGITIDVLPSMNSWDWKCQGCGKIEYGGWESSGKYYVIFYLDDEENK